MQLCLIDRLSWSDIDKASADDYASIIVMANLGRSMTEPEANRDSQALQPLIRDDGPLYRQLVDILRESIAEGMYRVGAALPRKPILHTASASA